jgi:uncharacterized membrane protein
VTEPGGRGLSGRTSGGPTATASLASPAGSAGLERSIARLLTVGTYASIGLLAIGFLLMIAAGIGPLSGGPAFDQARLVADLTSLQPAGFIWLGLVVVVATPAARVAASLVGYARRGEQAMTLVAVLILVVIAASVALAKGLEG